MIYINQVLQSVKDPKRIRIVEIKESHVYIVNVDAITSMPKKELFTSFLTDVEQREWIIITDPFLHFLFSSICITFQEIMYSLTLI